MSKWKKYYHIYRMGGPRLTVSRLRDRFLHTNRFDSYTYEICKKADPSEYPRLLEDLFYLWTETELHLMDPQTFNEKIQWMKLYDSTPLKTRLADKYLAREWIADQIGSEYLVPLLGVWDSFDQINFDLLPEQFVLKCNHGSGWNLVVTDKSKLDRHSAKQKFDQWMSLNFAYVGLELQYRDIPPKIIAEQYIGSESGIRDYRFYCFHGVPEQIWVDLYSGTPNHLRSIYDTSWNPVPMRCTWPDGGELLKSKPPHLQQMLEFSSKMSEDFPFVRVDFFDVDGKLYMGEMTFTPQNGRAEFEPPEWDRILGSKIKLPI